jgi:UDP:flavonoid glycosyltransferase YjiC (YdhE family)
VCHGGSGTLLASLAHGIPLVCVPRAADQFRNANNLARVGAGVSLTGDDVSEAGVRTALGQVLETPAIRTAARGVAEEIATMPSDAETAAAIEAFVGAG